MKRIMVIAVALMIALAGCSNTKSDADAINKQAVKESSVENVQDKTQSQDTEDTSNNTNSDEVKGVENKKISIMQ